VEFREYIENVIKAGHRFMINCTLLHC